MRAVGAASVVCAVAARAIVACAIAVCAIALTGSLLLAHVHPFGDAGLYAAKAPRAPLMEHSSIPPEVRATLTAKCADCHSMETRPPLYGRFAPVSWLVERDIVEGRKAMNLSLWDSYSADQQETFAAKIAQETKAHDMPLLQYRMVHWKARITDADIRAFTQWARTKPAIEASSVVQSAGEGDFLRGKEVFEKRCTGCHAMDQDREGPKLQGVFGRTSGDVAGFTYSPSLKKAHIVWDENSLERWLADPDTLVPGNNMDFHVAKLQERRDLIRFLKQSGLNRASSVSR
jgi:cytochrome c